MTPRIIIAKQYQSPKIAQITALPMLKQIGIIANGSKGEAGRVMTPWSSDSCKVMIVRSEHPNPMTAVGLDLLQYSSVGI